MKSRVAAAMVLLAAVAIAAVAALAPSDAAFDRIRESGVLRIGYAVEPPYAFITPDGRVTGESPEFARLVANEMGIERIDWVLTTFDALIPDLREGRFDAIAAGLFVTPERERLVAFAEPSLAVRAGLLVPKRNPLRLRSYRDVLADPAARVAVVSGSVEEARLRARGLPETQLLVVPDAITGCRAVESGAAQALALSRPTTRRLAMAFPALEAVDVAGRAHAGEPEPVFHVAAAFSQAHPKLLAAWNRAQGQVLGGPAHLATLRGFGLGEADVPGGTP